MNNKQTMRSQPGKNRPSGKARHHSAGSAMGRSRLEDCAIDELRPLVETLTGRVMGQDEALHSSLRDGPPLRRCPSGGEHQR